MKVSLRHGVICVTALALLLLSVGCSSGGGDEEPPPVGRGSVSGIITGPDGSVIQAHDFPFTDVDGAPLILEMDVDITEIRRAQACVAPRRTVR